MVKNRAFQVPPHSTLSQDGLLAMIELPPQRDLGTIFETRTFAKLLERMFSKHEIILCFSSCYKNKNKKEVVTM